MDPITSISTLAAAGAGKANTGATAGASAAAPFSSLIQNAVGEISRLEETAAQTTSQLVAGAGVDVHQAVIAVEKANMAFEMALSVRNKAMQAYQQVMNMQF